MKNLELLKTIPEVIDRSQFINRVLNFSGKCPAMRFDCIPVNKLKLALEGGIMTFLLHWFQFSYVAFNPPTYSKYKLKC